MRASGKTRSFLTPRFSRKVALPEAVRPAANGPPSTLASLGTLPPTFSTLPPRLHRDGEHNWQANQASLRPAQADPANLAAYPNSGWIPRKATKLQKITPAIRPAGSRKACGLGCINIPLSADACKDTTRRNAFGSNCPAAIGKFHRHAGICFESGSCPNEKGRPPRNGPFRPRIETDYRRRRQRPGPARQPGRQKARWFQYQNR